MRKMNSLVWNGKRYSAGKEIPESVYEEFIDFAYGRGDDLRDTLLWDCSYERGFTCPDGSGGLYAFAVKNGKTYYLGRFGPGDAYGPPSWDGLKEELLDRADRSDSATGLAYLREIYLHPGEGASHVGMKIADDPEAMKFFADYWNYVRWNEHGNEPALSEVGFGGFVEMILDPGHFLEYLSNDPSNRSRTLSDELVRLHAKYGKARRR